MRTHTTAEIHFSDTEQIIDTKCQHALDLIVTNTISSNLGRKTRSMRKQTTMETPFPN